MSDKITIITNNTPREVIFGYELTEKERLEFDYHNWAKIAMGEESDPEFFRYKGQLYDLSELSVTANVPIFRNKHWHLYQSDSFFSGILVKWPGYEDGNFEWVIVGRYYC